MSSRPRIPVSVLGLDFSWHTPTGV